MYECVQFMRSLMDIGNVLEFHFFCKSIGYQFMDESVLRFIDVSYGRCFKEDWQISEAFRPDLLHFRVCRAIDR